MPQATETFLKQYPEVILNLALKLRELVLSALPDAAEQVDLPAKMVAFSYGPKYADLICVIIPSQKGLKLGFNRGTSLPDPYHLLEGTGKISRYIRIESAEQLTTPELQEMLKSALTLYRDSR